MHSIEMSSSPFARPTPNYPFLPFTPLQSPPKKTRYPDATISEVPSFFIFCSRITPQTFAAQGLSMVSMWPIPLTPYRCCANVEHSERELLQPRPRPGGLVFHAGGLPLRPLPPPSFSSKCPPHFTQFHAQVFYTQVHAFVLPTCWVRHSYHALTSPSLTLLLTRVFPPRRRCANFATAGTVAAGNDFTLLGGITASRCWQVFTIYQHRRVLASTMS